MYSNKRVPMSGAPYMFTKKQNGHPFKCLCIHPWKSALFCSKHCCKALNRPCMGTWILMIFANFGWLHLNMLWQYPYWLCGKACVWCLAPRIAHAGRARGAIVNTAEFSGSLKNNTWLVETLQYVLSYFWTLCCSLFAFLASTVDWPLRFFSLSEPLSVGCVQHLFLHLTPPNMYVAKGQPRCPPNSVLVY